MKYSGTVHLGNYHGYGRYAYANGRVYLGYMYAGKPEFFGTVYRYDGAVYQGMMHHGQAHGVGAVTYADQSRDLGLWYKGRLIRIAESFPDCPSFSKLDTGYQLEQLDHCVLSSKFEDDTRGGALAEDSMLNNKEFQQKDLNPAELYNHQLRDIRSAGFPAYSYEKMLGSEQKEVNMVAWNISQTMRSLQKFIYRNVKCFPNFCNNLQMPSSKQDQESFTKLLNNIPEVLDTGPAAGQVQQIQTPLGHLSRASCLLVRAADEDHVQVLELLLRTSRVCVNVSDRRGFTALHAAAMRGNLGSISLLLNFGADPNCTTDEGVTPLWLCLALQYPKFNLRQQLDSIAVFDKLRINPPQQICFKWMGKPALSQSDRTGLTPSKNKPQANRYAQTKSAGANKNKRKKAESKSPEQSDERPSVVKSHSLPVAGIENGLKDSAQISNEPQDKLTLCGSFDSAVVSKLKQKLERESAFIGQQTLEAIIVDLIEYFFNFRCLHTNITPPKPKQIDLRDTIDLLLKRGASPDECSAFIPPLHLSVLAADLSLLHLLLDHGADVNVPLPAKYGGLSPLHLACAIPGPDSVRLAHALIDRGATVDAVPRGPPVGSRLLSPKLLKARGLTAEGVTPGELTPLHVACMRQFTGAMEEEITNCLIGLLVRRGASLTSLHGGTSPLAMAATWAQSPCLVGRLLLLGADPNQNLGPPHYTCLGLLVSSVAEKILTIQQRSIMVKLLMAFGAKSQGQYPADGVVYDDVIDFAKWTATVDNNASSVPKHKLNKSTKENIAKRAEILSLIANFPADDPQDAQKSEQSSENESTQASEKNDVFAEFLQTNFPNIIQCSVCGHMKSINDQSPCTGKHDLSSSTLSDGQIFGEQLLSKLLQTPRQKDRNEEEGGKRTEKLPKIDQLFKVSIDLSNRQLDYNSGLTKAESNRPQFCANCEKSLAERNVACYYCDRVEYCSKTCRHHHWRSHHAKQCEGYQGLSELHIQSDEEEDHPGRHKKRLTHGDKTKSKHSKQGSKRSTKRKTTGGKKKNKHSSGKRSSKDGEVSSDGEVSDHKSGKRVRKRRVVSKKRKRNEGEEHESKRRYQSIDITGEHDMSRHLHRHSKYSGRSPNRSNKSWRNRKTGSLQSQSSPSRNERSAKRSQTASSRGKRAQVPGKYKRNALNRNNKKRLNNTWNNALQRRDNAKNKVHFDSYLQQMRMRQKQKTMPKPPNYSHLRKNSRQGRKRSALSGGQQDFSTSTEIVSSASSRVSSKGSPSKGRQRNVREEPHHEQQRDNRRKNRSYWSGRRDFPGGGLPLNQWTSPRIASNKKRGYNGNKELSSGSLYGNNVNSAKDQLRRYKQEEHNRPFFNRHLIQNSSELTLDNDRRKYQANYYSAGRNGREHTRDNGWDSSMSPMVNISRRSSSAESHKQYRQRLSRIFLSSSESTSGTKRQLSRSQSTISLDSFRNEDATILEEISEREQEIGKRYNASERRRCGGLPTAGTRLFPLIFPTVQENFNTFQEEGWRAVEPCSTKYRVAGDWFCVDNVDFPNEQNYSYV